MQIGEQEQYRVWENGKRRFANIVCTVYDNDALDRANILMIPCMKMGSE